MIDVRDRLTMSETAGTEVGPAGFSDDELTALALAADPDNVGALVGSAAADVVEGVLLFVPDPMANFAAAASETRICAKGKRDRTCAKAERVERTRSPSRKETARGVRAFAVKTVTTKRS